MSSSSVAENQPGGAPNICHTCTEPITTHQFIRVGAYKFHKDHFTCSVCQTSLHEKKFHHKDSKFFCSDDYILRYCHTCRRCKQKIATGSVIQAFGGYYHPEHFCCATCEKPFKNGKYYESGEEPYCEEHYFLLTAEKCQSCGEGVKDAEMVRVQGKVYHSHCLSCCHCQLPLAKKGSIFQKDGLVYCRNDYLNFFCKRCTACADHILKHCVAEGSWVNTSDGVSVPIEQLMQHSRGVLGHSGEGVVNVSHEGCMLQPNEQECVQLRFHDGRELVCTPQHKVLTTQGYIEAQKLDTTHRIVTSIRMPRQYVLEKDSHQARLESAFLLANAFHMQSELDRSKCLTLARLTGFITSQSLTHTSPAPLRFQHLHDFSQFVNDCAVIRVTPQADDTDYTVVLPVPYTSPAFSLLTSASSSASSLTIPAFLLDSTCPQSIQLAFLSGLFGGAVTGAPSVNEKEGNFTAIQFACDSNEFLQQIQSLLSMVGLTSTIDGSILQLSSLDTWVFESRIGYAYCVDQQQRLTIASAWTHAFLQHSLPNVALAPVNELSHSTVHVHNLSTNAADHSFLNANQFIQQCNAQHFFTTLDADLPPPLESPPFTSPSKPTLSSTVLPTFELGVVSTSNAGFRRVYDIINATYRNFQVDGLLVSNCISVNDEFYHPDCLVCSYCKKKLDKYICISGYLRCNEHTELPVEPVKCSICTKVVEGEVVLSVAKKMHPECFKCQLCGNALQKANAKLKDDKLCCNDCMMKKDPNLQAKNAAAAALDTPLGLETQIDVGKSSSSSSAASAASPKVLNQDDFTAYKPHNRKQSKAVTAKSLEPISWKKGELIGKGSFGKVYMAMNSVTGELIAVKQVRLNTAEEQEQAAAIQNEIALMENLRHPNIVSLLGTQRNGNKLNILMEYVPGKCWSYDTPLMMHDGSIKLVRDIVVGDQLMGDDSTPRTVLPNTMVEGFAPMYQVRSNNSARLTWECNGEHILVLSVDSQPWAEKHATDDSWLVRGWELVAGSSPESQVPKKVQFGEHRYPSRSSAESAAESLSTSNKSLVFECTVNDYMKLSGDIKQSAMMFQPSLTTFPARAHTNTLKGRMESIWQRPVSESEVVNTAWMLGLWMAVGESTDAVLHCSSALTPAIEAWYLQTYGTPLTVAGNCGPLLRELLASYQMLGQKHFASDLLVESAAIRSAVLGGALDGSASLTPDHKYELNSSDATFLEGVSFFARSLGHYVTISKDNHMIISNKLNFIQPMHTASSPINIDSTSDMCCDGFDITCIGSGEYKGFRVSGNGRLLMADFVVTHNSLDSLLEKFGGFSEKVIRSYTKQLLLALEYCHSNRVVHRDIKGKNILLDTKGNLKLADFGSAKRFTNVMSKDAPSLSYNYTPLWTAPEVLVGDYNSKVDIWSLGCVIIEMASAKPPWSEQNFENPFRALYHIGNSDAIPKIPDTLSEMGINFVKQCLKRNPDERPDAATLLRQEWLKGIESLPNHNDDSGSEGDGGSGSESD